MYLYYENKTHICENPKDLKGIVRKMIMFDGWIKTIRIGKLNSARRGTTHDVTGRFNSQPYAALLVFSKRILLCDVGPFPKKIYPATPRGGPAESRLIIIK
jgi:hypothetical protein